jgi:hypothetical protein
MFWHYLRLRRISAQIVALALTAVIGLVIGRVAMRLPSLVAHNPAAVPIAYLLPLVSAVALGQATRSEARQFEHTSWRRLWPQRAVHVSIFLAAAIVACSTIGGESARAAMRNSAGFSGIVLLTAVAIGSERSWLIVTPMAIVTPAIARISVTGDYAGWAWFLRPVSPDTNVLAGCLLALGTSLYVIANSRRVFETETAAP